LLQLAPPQIVFVTEFAVDRWVIRRGPLGGVEDQLFFHFSGLWLMLPWTVFSGTMVLICWLMKKTNILS
jgi:hypothetical protein